MWRVMERLVKGEAQKREIDMLLDVTKQVEVTRSAPLATLPLGRSRASSAISARKWSAASTNSPECAPGATCRGCGVKTMTVDKHSQDALAKLYAEWVSAG